MNSNVNHTNWHTKAIYYTQRKWRVKAQKLPRYHKHTLL